MLILFKKEGDGARHVYRIDCVFVLFTVSKGISKEPRGGGLS